MHFFSCRYYRNHHWVIFMWYDILAVGLGEDEVDIGSPICLLYLHCHHLSYVLLLLGGGASSSRYGVDLTVNGHLVPLIYSFGYQRLIVLRLLKVVFQEVTFHQLIQLVCQGQVVAYGVAICLVEFAPSVLVGPHLPVGLRGHLQSCRYVKNSDQLLELYTKIMLRRRVSPRGRSSLWLLVGLLVSRALLLYGRLVHPHGLRSTSRSRSDKTDEATFLYDSIVRSDVCQGPTPDLAERLWVEPE